LHLDPLFVQQGFLPVAEPAVARVIQRERLQLGMGTKA
jgi:hypothetical protein